MMDKDLIRSELLAERLKLTRADVIEKSQKIAINLLKLKIFAINNNVSCYLPIKNEVETKFVIEQLIKTRVNIYLPYSRENEYFFAKFDGLGDLKKGPYGILQPNGSKRTDAKIIAVAILPGVAFSKDGVRLGYGKGVFDKLLTRSPALKIGLAYDFQIIDNLPKEKHDLGMDFIVTDQKVYKS